VVRYAVVGDVRPPIQDTLKIGDRIRTACMSRYGRKNHGRNAPMFSGKDDDGRILKNHQHAFYLPTYETQDREIDHITVIAPGGFNTAELEALFSLKQLRKYNDIVVNLLFQGCGTTDIFSDITILKKSSRWISSTPLILTRHTKYKGSGPNKRIVDTITDQIKNEIKNNYGETYKVTDVITRDSSRMNNTRLRSDDFFRWRRHGSVGDGRTLNIQLEFANPVRGPITIGLSLIHI